VKDETCIATSSATRNKPGSVSLTEILWPHIPTLKQMLQSGRLVRYGPLKAMPTSTGCRAVELQRQLLPFF
jgi:hypothetical protein